MITYISEFFAALLGVALPEVVCILFGLALAFLIFRALFAIFGLNTRLLDFTFYLSAVVVAISYIGGIEWTLSLL